MFGNKVVQTVMFNIFVINAVFHTLVDIKYIEILNGTSSSYYVSKIVRWMRFSNEWLAHVMWKRSCNLAAIISKSLCMDISHNLDFKFACWGCISPASFDLLWITSFSNEARA